MVMNRNMEEYEKASGAVHRMVDRAIRMDGTCTGEHGVGVGKKVRLLSCAPSSPSLTCCYPNIKREDADTAS
jgi:hypothetical protein